jgi:alkylation response protein AidB-like acyl-CoA dehydrogenase
MAEGSRWLTRRAASTPDDPYLASAAAAFACAAAAETYTATHQVSGGAGATSEHGLVRWTMRLVSLQQELGGQRGHNREVMTTRSTSANAELRFAGPHRA